MRKPGLALLIPIMLVLAGCGSFPGPAPEPLSTPQAPWTIKLTQTGGFVGVSLTVEISSDGRLVAENQRSGTRATSQIPASTMGQLRDLSGQILVPGGTPQPVGCADCFVYDLEITSPTGATRIHADDVTLDDTGARAVITLLQQLRDRALESSQ